MPPSSNNGSWRKRNDRDLPPISHIPNPTPEQARKIAALDANIQGTDGYIRALIARRASLARMRNALVPAVNLPPEVLTTIFEIACDPRNSGPNDDRIVSLFQTPFWSITTFKEYHSSRTTTPPLIGAVCSAWRNIAREATQLWSNIKIAFNDTKSDAQAAKKLRYWISKSGQRPLTVSLVEKCDEQDEEGGIWSTAVLDVLEKFAHRLQTLDMFFPEAWEREPATIARIANRLPLLTCVTLRPGIHLLDMQNLNLFAHAPKLREVRLYGCSTATVSLPLAQLERLELEVNDYSMVHECLERLGLCLHLRSYTTNIYGEVPNFVPVLPPMTHTKLEVIELIDKSRTQADIHAFLGALTLPMLRSFSLYIQSGDPLTGIPSLLPFLSRSAGKLEMLCLAGQMPLEEQLLGCLEVLPQLRKLMLNNERHRNTVLTQKTLDRMNPTKNGAADEQGARHCLAPNLEIFHYFGPIELTPHALVEFLADRWYGSSAAHISGYDVENQPGLGLEARMARGRLSPRVNGPLERLHSVAFLTEPQYYSAEPGIQFDDADTAVLQRLQQEGMSVVF